MHGIRHSLAARAIGTARRPLALLALTAGLTLPLSAPALATGPMGSLTGSVTAAGSATAIPGIKACVSELESQLGASELEFLKQCTTPDAAGHYTISELTAGTYLVSFSSGGAGPNYVAQYYAGSASAAEAQPIDVGAGQTAGSTRNSTSAGRSKGPSRTPPRRRRWKASWCAPRAQPANRPNCAPRPTQAANTSSRASTPASYDVVLFRSWRLPAAVRQRQGGIE
jgi:hypothetical protein